MLLNKMNHFLQEELHFENDSQHRFRKYLIFLTVERLVLSVFELFSKDDFATHTMTLK